MEEQAVISAFLSVDTRLKIMEEKLDKINNSFLPMLSLLQNVINANIPIHENPEQEKIVQKELEYKIIDNFIYIHGTKTFDAKETLKNNFNCVWDPSKKSWKFIMDEFSISKLQELFPNIVKSES